MLSEIEITYFRSRIDDVLRQGRSTSWQRRFLTDMRERIVRDGTRAQLSQKQMAMLRKLTAIKGEANLHNLDRQSNMQRRAAHVPFPQRPRRRWRYRYREKKLAFTAVLFVLLIVGQWVMGELNMLGSGSTWSPSSVTTGATGQRFTVTDGDTIKLEDGTSVRLIGFNTPEKFSPMCQREADLGHRATDRLKQLVAGGQSKVSMVPCACKPGTHGTSQCNYGRSCGILRVDGRDVGDILISEGLAARFVCVSSGCPPTPKPWCG